ncbi:hypothetical protein [Dickeya dadantii]|uniref:hypothetical protein n=1 Tax=Dickeya dadantii TaxID=204038 RepID=UPI0003A53B08|nr:hypothetical protein [Dickeya dadantii]
MSIRVFKSALIRQQLSQKELDDLVADFLQTRRKSIWGYQQRWNGLFFIIINKLMFIFYSYYQSQHRDAQQVPAAI